MFLQRNTLLYICVIQLVLITLLVLHAKETRKNKTETHAHDNDLLAFICKRVIQSATQSHPMLAYEHVMKARVMMSELTRRYGTLRSLEQALGLHTGRAALIEQEVNDQHSKVQAYLMNNILNACPEFDLELNHDARLVQPVPRDTE